MYMGQPDTIVNTKSYVNTAANWIHVLSDKMHMHTRARVVSLGYHWRIKKTEVETWKIIPLSPALHSLALTRFARTLSTLNILFSPGMVSVD